MLILVIVLALLALVPSLVLTLQVWEGRRWSRNRLRNRLRDPGLPAQRVALFVPCKGNELELETNLRPLVQQDYVNYEVHFIVEDENDPAGPIIRRVIDTAPQVPARLVVAGRAVESGQKVHNLRQATADLDDRVKVLAFADSDARPEADWLRGIVGLLNEKTAAVTGYRWMIPQHDTPANLVLSSINSAAASLMGPGGHFPVWGGAWVIRRDVFDATGMRYAWQGTLSDDLVASRVLHGAGWEVRFDPRSVVASPLDITPGGVWEFLHRQFLIGRRYATRWWLVTLVSLTLTQLLLWGSLVGLVVAITTASAWWPMAVVTLSAVYGLGVWRGWLRQDAGRRYLPEFEERLAPARRFDIWAGPLVATITWTAMLASSVGSQIAWRGIRYWISPGGRILLLGRQDDPESFANAVTSTPISHETPLQQRRA